jgi:hypothetical protein
VLLSDKNYLALDDLKYIVLTLVSFSTCSKNFFLFSDPIMRILLISRSFSITSGDSFSLSLAVRPTVDPC